MGGLAFLTSFEGREKNRDFRKFHISENMKGFDLIIKGAVANPGIFHMQSEIKLEDLLALAEVFPEADLHRFNLKSIVKKTRVIHIPLKKTINIHLKGAVKSEQTIKLPKGSKLENLVEFIELPPEADLKALKRKRRLKEGEVVYIPYLKK